ncbi:nickel/cobalt transporter [Streptomyces sp. NPDC088725]|uniref:nickel/cobalt transporter n=1 Tax=Streptomyces sp. NPDC088725 TaxID=3365873 RepID=UPI00381EDBEC
MTYSHLVSRAAATAAGVVWLLGVSAPAAEAHPLGNFSINHYTGFTLRPGRVSVLAVTDAAEIPTLQAAPGVDTDGDGSQSESERAAWATARCAETSRRLVVTTPRRLAWTVSSATFGYRPGQGGLRTSRLECRLQAPLDLSSGPVTLRADTGVDASRVGWNEITAQGVGAHLQHSSVPGTSSTGELRDYPRDLLATPRGDTKARFTVLAGDTAPGADGTSSEAGSGGGLTARFEALSQYVTSLAGARNLTVPVGLLAVLLSFVLGAGHALLPGHGKTVMAAYLAGRRGRTRDAVTVGATVTATHTAGVLVIGLCLTAFSSLAGDTVLNWLGVAGGALVTLVGASLLTDAARRARRDRGVSIADDPAADVPQSALVGAAGSAATPGAELGTVSTEHHVRAHGHDEGPAHGHGEHTHDHAHPHPHAGPHPHRHGEPHRHGLLGHRHTHTPSGAGDQPFTTRGLVGLGIAGGLVPSPSALIVLLGAVALGRTFFGAALVLAYGVGMASALTAVGLLLVRLGGRLGRLANRPAFALVRRVTPYTALLTALLVLVVGLGLMARSLPPVL